MGCKKHSHCYSKREEAAWSLKFLNNNDPVICTLLFASHIWTQFFSGSQINPCFQKKNSGCRLTGRVFPKIPEFFPLFRLKDYLKYGFCKKSLRKDAPLTSWTLHWSGKKRREKVFNWSEVHFSEVTSCKIHILVEGRNFHHTSFLVDCRTKTRLKC